MDKVGTTLLALFGIIVLLPILYLYGAWAGAFVITHLWAWYVMPAFGVGALKMIHAYGITLLVSYITYRHTKLTIKDERETYEKVIEIVILLLYPWMILGLGWLGVVIFM